MNACPQASLDERKYFCPGETYSISHALHLARLTSFFPGCKNCPHRNETEDLAPGTARRLKELPLGIDGELKIGELRIGELRIIDEAVTGVYLNELEADHARRWAETLGVYLRSQDGGAPKAPTVVIGGDDRPLAAEVVAAASRGLRMTTGRVIDVGGVSAAAMAFAVEHLQADGGLLVGNSLGEPHHISLKFWRRGARPLSAGGELDLLEQRYRQGVDRPGRHRGTSRRFRVEVPYLACLHKYFHALRPLRFVLDTSCRPLVRYLETLLEHVAPQVTLAGRCRRAVVSFRSDPRHVVGELAERFSAPFSQRVVEEGAHFGIRIDEDGEVARVTDQRGHDVAADDLMILIARHLLEEHPARAVAIEQAASPRVSGAISAAGGSAIRCGATREAMDETMRASEAIFGGGPSGRFWYREANASPDALKTLTMLLTILSKSDAPLSQVVDELTMTQ